MRRRVEGEELADNPLWYKNAIIYEIHVRAFNDSNADGIGDFNGLIEKLDYLQDLGVTALWLLPFYPSPLRDGGYDIADYTSINPVYGTLRDFSRFLKEAHARGLRVITELVLNHTSNEHEWFQRARRAPAGSRWRNFYVWSDSPKLYGEARIIFKDFETSNWSWDPVAGAYYWHRFYSHQPDLNFDNPEVHKTMLKAVDFWLALGVDGLRLDAVPYLFERDGTNCENLPETHAFLKTLRAHVDHHFPNRMLLAEANQWPEDAAAYFGNGDECHMNFHFPLMPRMFMAVHLEDRFPIIDILRQTPNIPESCQWATFLRNHDELTLEMVTDEDRDYMYRVYAEDPNARINLGIRRRLAPLVKGRRKMELMNGLLFSLPGTPVLYYGDEIGMGDNIYLGDRDGVRTPMQWSSDRNAGFSRCNGQKLYLPITTDPEYHYEAFNVQAQQGNPSSLLWWMKRLIAIRKRHQVFGSGAIEFLQPENHKVLAFLRVLGEERVLVVANLSRFTQFAEIDLSRCAGMVPVEMFGNTPFPAITERPYFVTLGPHAFYWFSLDAAPAHALGARGQELPRLETKRAWTHLFSGNHRAAVEAALVSYTVKCRWFRSKARIRKDAAIVDVIELPTRVGASCVVLVRINYAEGDPEVYVLPIAFAAGEEAQHLARHAPHAIIAAVSVAGAGAGAAPLDGVLYDALVTGVAANALLDGVQRRAVFAGDDGQLQCQPLKCFKEIAGPEPLQARTTELEQSNSTILFGERLLLKVYRQLEEGVHPELEVGAFLAEHAPAGFVPRIVGAIQYKSGETRQATLATVQELVPNEGVAWQLTLDAIERYFDRMLVAATTEGAVRPTRPSGTLLEQSRQQPTTEVVEQVGGYWALAGKLGRRVGELHLALSRADVDPAFVPEPYTGFHQRSLFQGAHGLLMRTLEILRRRLGSMNETTRAAARAVIDLETQIDRRFRAIAGHKIEVAKIRCHGDLHLGQILYTGTDFVIIDFEGEPSRPLNERRYKRSSLRDVSGMLRSFQYATEAVLRGGRFRAEDLGVLRPWADAWSGWISAAFLKSYFDTVGAAPFIPANEDDKNLVAEFYLLEKCVYEVAYELNNRPDWLEIPLRGLLELMGAFATPTPSPPPAS